MVTVVMTVMAVMVVSLKRGGVGSGGGDIDDLKMVVVMVTAAVLIIYRCIANYSQNLTVQKTHIYYLIVSVDQESGHGLAGYLWLQVSHKTATKVLAWVAISSIISTSGESASKLTHDCWQDSVPLGLLDLAGCWPEASLGSLPCGPLHRAAGFPQCKREATSFCSLILK